MLRRTTVLPRWRAQAIDFGVEFPFVKDSDGSTAKALGVERTPEVIILDAQRRFALPWTNRRPAAAGWCAGPN